MKKLLIAIIIIILIAIALVYWKLPGTPPSKTATDQSADSTESITGDFPPSTADTTESITKDLNSLEVGSPDADFNSVEADINSF